MVKKYLFPFLAGLFVLLLAAGCESIDSVDIGPTATASKAPVTPTVALHVLPSPTPKPLKIYVPTSTPQTTDTPEGQTTTSVVVSSGKSEMDKYQYVGQNWPDGMKVSPGAILTVTWAIKNTGTIGWTSDYSIKYFSGVKASKDYYAFPNTVPVGRVVNLSITIHAPKTLGSYSTWWKISNGQGQNFGDVDFTFEVSNSH